MNQPVKTEPLELVTSKTVGEAVRSCLRNFQEDSERAGRMIVQLFDSSPTAKQEFLEENSDIHREIIDGLERVGRRQVYYKWLIDPSIGAHYLSKCVYSDQVKHSTEPFELLLLREDGTTDTILVKVEDVTQEHSKQIFFRNRIRGLGEQRAYLESLKPKPKSIELSKDYTIYKGKITFNRPPILTMADLVRLMAEITQ